jgi:serine/threonine-protein kinase
LPQPLAVTRFALTLPESQRLNEAGGQILAISPDGTRLVYVANRRLFVRSMSDLEARPVNGTEEGEDDRIANPVFSPDGQSLAFVSGNLFNSSIKTVPVGGGTPVMLIQFSSVESNINWTTKGVLFAQRGKGIVRVPASGGEPELLVSVPDGLVASPQVLPDGDSVLFALAQGFTDPTGAPPDTWDHAKIVIQSIKSGQRTTLVDGGGAPLFAPTGHIVYAVAGSLFAVPVDYSRRRVTGPTVAVVEGVARPTFAAAAPGTVYYRFSASGTLAYFPGPAVPSTERIDLAFFDRTGAIQPLTLRPSSYQFPRVSPDGKFVAVGTDDGRTANVWIYELSGASLLRQLTVGGKNRYPAWSRDSTRVAFQSDRDGDLGIYVQPADGSAPAERLTRAEAGAAHVPESWSRDGRTLLYSEARAGEYTLWTLTLPDKKAARFGEVRSTQDPPSATFSPDDRWVAYLSTDRGTRTVFVEPFPPNGVKHTIGTGLWHPVWSADGARLFYRGSNARQYVAGVQTRPSFTVGNPEIIAGATFQARGRVEREYDIAPDGRLLGLVTARRNLLDGAADRDSQGPQIKVVLNWFEELKQRVPSR